MGWNLRQKEKLAMKKRWLLYNQLSVLTLGACTRVTVLALSFVHSFCPSSYRDHRSLFKLGKGMNWLILA